MDEIQPVSNRCSSCSNCFSSFNCEIQPLSLRQQATNNDQDGVLLATNIIPSSLLIWLAVKYVALSLLLVKV